VLEAYEEQLREVFALFAKADTSSKKTAQINISEWVFLLDQGGLIGGELSLRKAGDIFMRVATLLLGDGNEMEIGLSEFKTMLTCVCDLAVDDDARLSEQFEETLARWLKSFFVPTYMKLVASSKTTSRTMGGGGLTL